MKLPILQKKSAGYLNHPFAKNAVNSNLSFLTFFVLSKLEVYIYNVTNAEPFLNGSQPLKVVEIGPYVYAAPQAKKVLKWSTKGEKVTFQSKTTYLSENQNGLSDLVVVPNLLVFGGMLKNEVKDSAEDEGATFNLLQYLVHCYPSSRA